MQGAGAHKSRGNKIYWGRRSEDAWRGLVVELLREAAGRNKGREEGDVQSIRRGWMLRGCELRTTVFCRKQRDSAFSWVSSELFCALDCLAAGL
jgi:hypothetical protein